MTAAAAPRAVSAADSVRVGVIGSGGRGQLLTGEFKEIGAQVAAVCDVYQPNLAAGLKAASTGAKSYTDYRALLEDKSLDAVVIATPDHWHAKMAIDAADAGKDVYVEKPLCHEIADGFAMRDAIRRNKRVCQVGTQRRSSTVLGEAKKIVDSGRLGDVRLVTCVWMNYQPDFTAKPLAGELDWNAWLGPAPKRDLDPTRFFNWYYYWDYSGGLLVGQAAHIFDEIQWFMGSQGPAAATCAGGRVNVQGAEVPETATASLEYAENYLSTFTIGYKSMKYHTHNDQLLQVHGSKARLDVPREGYTLWPEQRTLKMNPEATRDEPGSFEAATRAHIRNFLECVQTRNEPNAPVEEGLKTAIALIMTVTALRSGRRVRWNPSTRSIES
jgi:predicted dehydrogenase